MPYLQDDHRLVVPIKDELHDVLLGHLGQLTRKYVLQVDEQLHALVSAIIAYHLEVDDALILLHLGVLVALRKP
jgi:hypothetical protein